MSTMKPTGSPKLCILTVLTVFLLVSLALSENKGSSLRDALRNNTRYEQSSERKEDGVEALKIEAQKFLKQCGGTLNQSANNSNNRYGSGTGSERNYSNRQNNNKGYGSNVNEDRFENRNNNGQSWENSNNDGDWNIDSGNRERNRPRGSGQNPNNGNEGNFYGPTNNPSSSLGFNDNQPDRRNMRQPGGNNKNTQQDYEMWTPSYQPSGSNNDFNVRTRFDGNTRFNRPSSEECRDQALGNGNIPRSPFGSSNLPRRQRSSYFNREDDDNDNDCISQCVLGYMQLLDTDRSPSETLIIKWLQEHVTRNEMDRIKALRDTRKCFGKLVTTDIEDGCEYAKELSKCLELDLE